MEKPWVREETGLILSCSLFLFPQIEDDIMKSTYCSQAYDCSEPDDSGMSICKYKDDNYEEQIVECYRGE